MVMSRDPGFKFRKFLFLPSSVLNFRKVTKFGGNWLKNTIVTGKKQVGGGKHPPRPVLTGLNKSHINVIRLCVKIFPNGYISKSL